MTNKFLKESAYIDGRWIEGAKERITVTNPANNEIIGTVPSLGEKESASAIAAAVRAFPSWRALTAYERSEKLRKLFELHIIHKDSLAQLMTLEQGKPLKEAEREVLYGAAYFEWYAEEAKRVYGETVPAAQNNKRVIIQREPLGVCAAITPWNFPNAMLARKAAPALAAGCTFIGRPASETPFSALAIATLCEEAGIPPGVFNIVTGNSRPITKALMDSKEVRKITFTGSTEVGRILMKQSADTLKRLTMELGGDAPFIVFEDADLDRAANDAIFAKFRNAGQTCVCINRFLIHESVTEEFLRKFIAQVKKLKVGDGLKPDTDIGPLISAAAAGKLSSLLEDAVSKGAKLLCGAAPKKGSLFMEPCVITSIKPSMQIASEEIFGPIAALQSFSSEEQAISMANNTDFGLASYFYTKDISRMFRVAEALQYGMVGINDTAISATNIPFGGIKQSGFGREGGHWGIEEYLNIKYLAIGV